MLNKTYVSSVATVAIATIASATIALPAQAEFLPYRFVSGKESIRLDPDSLATLESIGLTISTVENLVPPAPGFDFAWPVVPPAMTAGDRGTTFEFLFDEETDIFLPTSGTIEFNGSFFFELDPSRYSLTSPLELGELSVFFTESSNEFFPFDFFAMDTATTNLPIMSVNTFSAPTVDVEAGTWFLEPIELVFTQEFSDFLVDAALTQQAADDVAAIVPGLNIGEARGDRDFVPLEVESVPEPSTLLGVLMLTGTAFVTRKKH